jgi:Helicase associated domain
MTCRYGYVGAVPTKCSSNPSLGRWVSTQRSQYKNWQQNSKTSMTEEKMRRLEAIGFVWSMVEF